MTTQIAPRIELIVLDSATSAEGATEAQARRLRRHLDRNGRRDWAMTIAHDVDGLDGKALRQRFAGRDAAIVAFVRLDDATDHEQLLAPLARHGRASWLPTVDRRAALKAAGGLGALALLAACGSKSSSTTTSTTAAASTSGSTTASTAAATSQLALAPETTEGPYYLDLNLVRTDIREDRKGAAMNLKMMVVDETGKAVPGAAVDIWHCDAEGLYSGFVGSSTTGNASGAGGPGGAPPGGGAGGPPPGGGGGAPRGGGAGGAGGGTYQAGDRTVAVATAGDPSTFLRGTQVAGTDGTVAFTTIYPGWYQGRTVHIHVLVHVAGKAVHVGQLFFDDAFTDSLYAAEAPYSSRSARTTRNAADGIFAGAGGVPILAVQKGASGYAATVTVAVKKA